MANQQILTYLTQNKDQYSISELKTALLGSGYPETEIDEAVSVMNGSANAVTPQNLYDNGANHTLETIHGNISANEQTPSSMPQNNVISQSFANSQGPDEYSSGGPNPNTHNNPVQNTPSIGASGSLGYGNQDLYPSPKSQDQIMAEGAMLDAQRGDKKFGKGLAIGLASIIVVGLGFFGFQRVGGFLLFCSINLSSDQKQYENSSFGIKIGYPRNWEYIEIGSSKQKMIVFAANTADTASTSSAKENFPLPLVSISFVDLKTTDSKDLNKAEAEITAGYANMFKDYKLEKKADIQMGCKKAKQLIFTMSDNGSTGKIMQTYTVVGNKGYILTYGAKESVFDSALKNANDMVASFEPTN